MTKEQVTTYEYCKQHLACIKTWKEKLPFNMQKYGCGGGTPNIEHTLEKIHNKMYEDVRLALDDANDIIQKIIDAT